MIEMMFLEHVILAVCFSIVASAAFVIGASLAQLIDVDHVLNSASEATFYQKFNRALDSVKLVTSDGYFEDASRGLHRGFLHRPLVFFTFVVFVIGLVGVVFGWFLHLSSDGISIINWNGL